MRPIQPQNAQDYQPMCVQNRLSNTPKKDVIMVRKIYQTTQAIARYFIKSFVKNPSYKLV